MRVLVTGGAGFIGSTLAIRLLQEGHEVVIVDNESTGRRENVPEGAEYIKADVTDDGSLEPAFRDRINSVCHIAGHVSLVRSFADPVLDLRTNVQGTVNVLQRCVKHRVSRLLYASSMTVYGTTAVHPTPETAPCCPISYYGITKYAAERYVHTTSQRVDLGHEFNVTSFRMYNVYGPRQALDNPYQGVLGIFIGNVLRGEPVTIFGDGHQTRDFVYIDDVVDAWVRALERPATYGRAINLGSGIGTTIRDVAGSVLTAFGKTSAAHPVVYAPARPGEQRHAQADITMGHELLGWKPVESFPTGLEKTIEWADSANATELEQKRDTSGIEFRKNI